MAIGVTVALASLTVGTILSPALLIGPAATALRLTRRPAAAMTLATVFALATVWGAIALSYQTDWPIGFFVGTGTAAWYLLARLWAAGGITRRVIRWLAAPAGSRR